MIFPVISLAILAATVQPSVADSSEPSLVATLQEADEADEVAGAEEAEEPKWTGAVTVGISLTEGNTDIQKASAGADAVKETDGSRYTLGFAWNFSEENGVVNQRKTFIRAQRDRFISEKMYWLVQASAEADNAAGVDLRTTIGAGLGYQFKDSDKFKLSGEAGLSWFNEEFESGTENDYISARLAYNWAYLLSDKWAFEQSGEIFPSLEDSEDVYTKIDTRAKATLTDNMFAQLQWVWDWDNTPAPGNERADHLYLITVGWKF